ncbi:MULTISPECIES: diacylglycerol kinase [Paenibacillus]|uniref:Diacylglycerol kinase n=1 Tax=Paenibacillus anseongense TaxID=2682845 RepID=A0ABW9TZ21_9BACL|nr:MULTISPECIES: diacylglycerol kinase [Paenibacillus]MBA2943596.1 diacylglycerol kinase [Paenibacillus sp. CGMCC 1.16610]MVQ33092.1 diacylglycerol kinase [Paenibacillus anseongense]
MVKRARLIYNPTSGREEMKKRLPEVLQRLERGGFETSAHATIGEGDATLAAAEAVNRGFDLIIAAGGDGTLCEVVNGMAEKEGRPPLGILPLGTTNDFARALGIPKNLEQACDLIIQQYSTDIDVGKINNRYFINIAGGGSMTELTYEVPSKLKTMIGQLAYYMKGLEKLPRLKPIELYVKAGDLEFHDEVMMFLVGNTNSVGGFEKLVPEARMNDGLFDVLILRKCNLAEFIRVVTLALRGEHLNDPNLIYFQTNHIEINSPDYVQLNLDGEFGGTLPCVMTNLKSHLQIIVDESGQSIYKKTLIETLTTPFQLKERIGDEEHDGHHPHQPRE